MGKNINEMLEFYKTCEPGKYWQLPKEKRDQVEQLLYNENVFS